MRRWIRRKKEAFDRWLIDMSKKRIMPALQALILGLPPLSLAYLAFDPTLSLPFQSAIKSVLLQNWWLIAMILFWPLLWGIVSAWAADRVQGMETDGGAARLELVALITALNDIKGLKLHRFAKFTRDVKDHKAPAEQTFLSITQPGLQLGHIMIMLHHVLTIALKDNSIKLVLARIADERPSAWRCHMPNDTLLPDNLLGDQAGKTMFAACARSKRVEYIPDIEKHLDGRDHRYVPIGEEEDRGSIVCVPVLSQELGKVLYVLSIKSDTPGTIDKKCYKRYKTIVESFVVRMNVEAHLELLREYAGGHND